MKNVLINGGSRGIGRAMVELFCKRGYSVAFTYKNSDADALELQRLTGALAIKADSASEKDVSYAVKKAENALGNIEILINNAAVSSFSMFTDLTLEEWERAFSVNVTGAFLYSREVIPSMVRNQSGRIINVSSIWGITGASCEVHYSATKAALIGLTKALAKELGPSKITVNCIAPGVIDTEMNRSLSNEDMEALKEDTPLMRIGTPCEIAEAAYFLSGDGAAFITGEVLNVSGGYLI